MSNEKLTNIDSKGTDDSIRDKLKKFVTEIRGLFNTDDKKEPDKMRRSIFGAPVVVATMPSALVKVPEVSVNTTKYATILRLFIGDKGGKRFDFARAVSEFPSSDTVLHSSEEFLRILKRATKPLDIYDKIDEGKFNQIRRLLNCIDGSDISIEDITDPGFKQYLEDIGMLNPDTEGILKSLKSLASNGDLQGVIKQVRARVCEDVRDMVALAETDFEKHAWKIPELEEYMNSHWGVFIDEMGLDESLLLRDRMKNISAQLDFMTNGKIPDENQLEDFAKKETTFISDNSILTNTYRPLQLFAQRQAAQGKHIIIQGHNSDEVFLVNPRKFSNFKQVFDKASKLGSHGFVIVKGAKGATINGSLSI